jgi:hypothetical protein
MTYDTAREQIVLFGGEASFSEFPDATWTWNGDRWSEVPSGGAAPSARVHHAMTYDAARAEVVMFGGFTPPSSDRGDTWLWNGSAWTRSGTDLAPRTHARMTYDANRGAAIVVGGSAASDPVLVRDATTSSWHPLGVAGLPARYLTGVAFDRHRNVLVVFGGGDPKTDRLLDDLWELDASSWREVSRR